jgi:hypothetical protein
MRNDAYLGEKAKASGRIKIPREAFYRNLPEIPFHAPLQKVGGWAVLETMTRWEGMIGKYFFGN